jgi:SNF2 family DNA or RNA helicase
VRLLVRGTYEEQIARMQETKEEKINEMLQDDADAAGERRRRSDVREGARRG